MVVRADIAQPNTTAAALAAQTIDLVQPIVHWVSRTWPTHVDRDELISAGMLGLVQAAERWDESTGVPFRSFASWRVRGAVLDAARSMDPLGRVLRSRFRSLEEARTQLRVALGRDPEPHELASATGLTLDELHDVVRQASVARPGHLDVIDEHGESTDGGVADPSSMDPLDAVELDDQRQFVRQALGSLRERERFVITAIYLEGRTADSVARLLGVTPSRISQIHQQALGRLRRQLESRRG